MRKFLRKSYPALLLFLTFSFTDVEHDEDSTRLLGSWEYLAPNIGMTFQKGAIEFSYDEEVLIGNVIFDDRIIQNKVKGLTGRYLRAQERGQFSGYTLL